MGIIFRILTCDLSLCTLNSLRAVVSNQMEEFFCLQRVNSGCVSRECSGSVVECLTGDQRAAGSSLIGVTALCP